MTTDSPAKPPEESDDNGSKDHSSEQPKTSESQASDSVNTSSPSTSPPDTSASKVKTSSAAPDNAPSAARRASTSASTNTHTTKVALPAWAWLVLLILIVAAAGLGFRSWQEFNASQLAAQQTQQLQQQLIALQGELAQWQGEQQQQLQGDLAQQAAIQDSVAGLDQRLSEHSRRLRSLSTTSREDWLLAEAEYLLRLAQQRLLMERSGSGAVALLVAADDILRQVDDADLFPVRDKLQRDITQLKLLPQVDRQGLYLQLLAVIGQIEQLPMIPVWQAESLTVERTGDEQPVSDVAETGVWPTVKASFWRVMAQLKDQVRIRRDDEPLQPLLPPDAGGYLKQNLRFLLEQAQLAMLREETAVYQASLAQADALLLEYFATQDTAQRLAAQVRDLAAQPIAIELPSINGSLLALQDYIRRLHRLDDRAGTPQLSEQDSSPAEAP